MPSLELYSYAACPYAQRTRMTLIEKGLDCRVTEIDLGNRPEWFREVSPYGKVPCLRHGGETIYESAIINQYLDETFPEPPLMPADPVGRAKARIWMDYCETRFLTAAHRLMTERDDEAKSVTNRAALAEVMRFIEREAFRKPGDGPWFMGGQFTLVDLQYAPFFERFGTYEHLAGAEWPEDCTSLRAWFDALRERESYRQTARPLEEHLEARRAMLEQIARRRAAAAG